MNQSHYPLRVNVGFLINAQVGESREMHFEFEKLHLPPDMDVNDLKGVARFSRTVQGILCQGKFEGTVSIECVRCLTQYEQELNTEFDELFAFASKGTTEAELILSDTGNIDLAPLVWEYLALELPIKPLCKPDCRGLCIICGEDLNIGECEHSRQQPTPD